MKAVIEGWQELLTNMKVGMKVKAWIPSELGYGEAGAPPAIPGNSLLIFEVELLEVQAANPPADTINVKPIGDSTQVAPAEVKADSTKPAAPATEVKQEPAKAAEATPAAKTEEPAAEKKQEAAEAAPKTEPAKAAEPAKKK